MAYAAVVTGPTNELVAGVKHSTWSVVETDCGPTDEFTLSNAPTTGTITLYKADLGAGAGATIAPQVGRTVGFVVDTHDHINTQSPADDHIDDATGLKYSGLTASKLYVRSSPNAGADNVVTTTITIRAGH